MNWMYQPVGYHSARFRCSRLWMCLCVVVPHSKCRCEETKKKAHFLIWISRPPPVSPGPPPFHHCKTLSPTLNWRTLVPLFASPLGSQGGDDRSRGPTVRTSIFSPSLT